MCSVNKSQISRYYVIKTFRCERRNVISSQPLLRDLENYIVNVESRSKNGAIKTNRVVERKPTRIDIQ